MSIVDEETMLTSQSTEELYREHMLPTYAPWMTLVRGDGCYVWDADGNRYLDLVGGIAVNTLGHAHPAIQEAIVNQAGRLMHVSNLFYNEPQAQLAAELSRVAGGGWCSFFCNSGAEANEGLIKLARRWGGGTRFEVITLKQSFHGRTLATLTATGQDKVKVGFDPLPAGFIHVEAGSIEALKAAVSDRTAAVLLEVVQGEGGVRPMPHEYLRAVRALCDERGLLLLFDEVQTGMGRTGHWFAWQGAGVQPDAFSLAKGLGGGIPIGAVMVKAALRDVLSVGSHATTFGGNPLCSSVALSVLRTIEKEGILEHVQREGAWFREQLTALKARCACIREVRGVGFMIGVELDRPVAPILAELRRRGLLLLPAGERVLRMVPALVLRHEQISESLEMLESVLAPLGADGL
jgi:predicted acetylornithine/succinylornithine family transaminase